MTRGEKVIAFCERHLRIPEGKHVGKPIKLMRFQRQFVLDVYDNPHITSRAYLSLGRKNGKTALIACILLAHLIGPEAKQNTQIVSGALSRDQAALVFSLAAKMIRLNPDLAELVHIVDSGKRLIGKPMNTEFRALSAEAGTAHGLSPVLAILDEIGQIKGPSSAFVEAIETSQGAHEQPLLIAISTQAPTDGDLFSMWLDDAAKSKDPRIVSHLYTANDDADLMDRDAWMAANPAMGEFRSVTDLEDFAQQAIRLPSKEASFRWLYLNQRIDPNNPFISRAEWGACASTAIDFSQFEGKGCWAGLDLSQSRDLTALVLAFRDDDDNVSVLPTFWLPFEGIREKSKGDRVPYDIWAEQGFLKLCNGSTIDPAEVVRHTVMLDEKYGINTLAYDPWRIADFERELDKRDMKLNLQRFGQGLKDMSPALDKLERLIAERQFKHPNNPTLNMCFANAVVYSDSNNNRKLDKKKAAGRIDGAVATAMAVGVMADAHRSYLEYETLMVL